MSACTVGTGAKIALQDPAPQDSKRVDLQGKDPSLEKSLLESQWLEELEGKEASAFVAEENARSLKRLTAHPKFQAVKERVKRQIIRNKELSAKKDAFYIGDLALQVKRDEKHVKGLLRMTSKEKHKKARIQQKFDSLDWQNLIDFDALKDPRLTGIDHQFSEIDCYKNDARKFEKCLLVFSHSGSDSEVMLEYDLKKRRWAESPMDLLMLGKHSAEWVDEQTMLVLLDEMALHNAKHPDAKLSLAEAAEKGLVTKSGYPIRLRLWRRGQAMEDAKLLYQGDPKSAFAGVVGIMRYQRSIKPESVFLLREGVDFYRSKYFLMEQMPSGDYRRTQLDFPEVMANYMGFTDTHEFIFLLKQPWKGFAADSLIAFSSTLKPNGVQIDKARLVRAPSADSFLEYAYVDRGERFDPEDDVIISASLKDVSSETEILRRTPDGKWLPQHLEEPLALKPKTAGLWKDQGEEFHFVAQNFLQPQVEYLVDFSGKNPRFEEIDRDPSEFEEKRFKTEQIWVDRGKDESGKSIKVPYFIVYDPKKISLKGNKQPSPTLLYGYGGFAVSIQPSYLDLEGRNWLEEGGVYVIANIRGGGEFGGKWHQSALLTKRQTAYDDFIAVAEDLIARGITKPSMLGIQGGSNGGLLVAAVVAQRPELFGAVLCEVPLTDMLRYHKLLAGASWMAEYGDPDGAEREFWLQRSPLQNLSREKQYPKIFLSTNRFDDRVHPAHARKMAKVLHDLGKDFYFYEDAKGGHGGTSKTSEDEAFDIALNYSYLYTELID